MPVETSEAAHRYALLAAVGTVMVSPLLALGYFATPAGADSADEAILGGWIDPIRELAGDLVTFASPDTVYAVYTLLVALLFPAIMLSARVTMSSRPHPSGGERWGWRLALAGYALFGAGLLLVALLLLATRPDAAVVDVLFMAMMAPGLLVGLIGSTVLGFALLRASYRPRLTAWLLTLAMPLWFLGSAGLGHNSLGIVPLFIAWAVAMRSFHEPAGTGSGVRNDTASLRPAR